METTLYQSGNYAYLPLERVIFGRPAAEAAVEEAARIDATRVFIVASKTLATKTPVVRTIAEAFGRHYVGLFDGCVQHSPRASVIAATRAVRAAAPDLILTVGGGTAIDTVKVLQICSPMMSTRPKRLTACTSRSVPTASGRCRISGLRRCGRSRCRPRYPAPSSRTSPGSPTSVSAKSIRSSGRMSGRAP
jgi:hypothetical protein